MELLTFADYFLVTEANLFNQERLLHQIDSLLQGMQCEVPEIKNWFHTQYLKWYLSPVDDDQKSIRPHNYKDGEPEWAKKEGVVDFFILEPVVIERLGHIIDYFQQLPEVDLKKIYKEPYPVIVQKVKQWDVQLRKHMQDEFESNDTTNVKVEYTFPDGFKVVRLLTQEAYTAEGNVMGHCVGGYFKTSAPTEETGIFSLRDPKGLPHVTIQLSEGFVVQIKGKENAAPIPKYMPYIIEFLKKAGYPLGNKLGKQMQRTLGLIKWSHAYYFKDSPTWAAIYEKDILPGVIKTLKRLDRNDPMESLLRVKKISGIYVQNAFAKVFPPVTLQVGNRFVLKNQPAAVIKISDSRSSGILSRYFMKNLETLQEQYHITFEDAVYVVPVFKARTHVQWACYIKGRTPSGKPVVFAKKPGYMTKNTLHTEKKVITGYHLLSPGWAKNHAGPMQSFLESVKYGES